MTTPTNYTYTPQGPVEYPDQSTTPTLRRPNPSNVPTSPSGFQEPDQASTRQPITFAYQAAPIGPNAPSPYNETRSRWPAASGIPRQLPTETVQTARPYLQGNYDGPTRLTAASGTQLHYEAPYGGQTVSPQIRNPNTAPLPSMAPPVSYDQSRRQAGPSWSSQYDNTPPVKLMASSGFSQQHDAPLRENTASRYQNQYPAPSGQIAPSGFGVRSFPAAGSLHSAQVPPSVQREVPNYLPAATRGRPQSLYSPTPRLNSSVPQYEGERPGSYDEDALGDVTTEMANSTLSGQSYRRSSVGMLF